MGGSRSASRGTLVFEALSYEWGPPSSSQETSTSVLLNSVPKSVRPNLFDALLHLRYQDRERVLWIDALCINQEDIGERNRQVRQMGQIYSSATCVIVWIGSMLPFANSTSKLRFEQAMHWLAREDEDLPPQEGLYQPEATDLKLVLAHLANGSYWRRTWIIQELFLARELHVQYACFVLIPSTFDKIGDLCNKSGIGDGYYYSSAAVLLRERETYQLSRSTRMPYTLQRFLWLTRVAEVSDLRDKVYGVLGLPCEVVDGLSSGIGLQGLPESDNIVARAIPIDYNKSVQEVYSDVVEFYIARGLFKQATKCSELLQGFLPTASQTNMSLPVVDNRSRSRSRDNWWIYEKDEDEPYAHASGSGKNARSGWTWKSFKVTSGRFYNSRDLEDNTLAPFSRDLGYACVLMRQVGHVQILPYRIMRPLYPDAVSVVCNPDQAFSGMENTFVCEGWKLDVLPRNGSAQGGTYVTATRKQFWISTMPWS